MAYKPAKRKQYRRRPRRRVARVPRQAISTMVKSIVNKNRETKRLFLSTSFGLAINSGTKGPEDFVQFDFPNSGQPSGVVANLTEVGSAPYQRDGNQITPKYFCFKGLLSMLGDSLNAAKDETSVRIVAGFTDVTLADTNTTLQMSNGVTQAISPDFLATYRKFNWQKFRPFYDKVHKLGAPYVSAADDTGLAAGSVAIGSNTKVSKMINIKHYFGKSPKNITYPRQSDGVIANSNNIQVLMIVRNAHDVNYHSGQLTCNLVGEGHFSFMDC